VRAEPRPAAGQTPYAGPRRPRRRPLLARGVLATGLAVVLALAVLGAVKLFTASPVSQSIDATVIGSSGTAQLQRSGARAELILHHFPPPPPGHVYEVWLKRAGRPPAPTSALFSVTAAGAGEVAVPGDLHGVGQVLVTPEPDGGSRAPTHTPVIVAQLS
ncbi:MAG: anti-sigma factor, partial [Solirubrobacteraceae bacterium]